MEGYCAALSGIIDAMPLRATCLSTTGLCACWRLAKRDDQMAEMATRYAATSRSQKCRRHLPPAGRSSVPTPKGGIKQIFRNVARRFDLNKPGFDCRLRIGCKIIDWRSLSENRRSV